MYRVAWFRVLSFVLALICLSCVNGSVTAQSTDEGTPQASGTPDATGPNETVWFVIAPEGKGNGDYFDIHLGAGESATVSATIGNGSEIPVNAIIYAANAYSGINGGFNLNDSTQPVSDPATWVDFPTDTRVFQPKEVIQTTFTVSVPAGTPPGQYITGIAVETADAKPMPGSAQLLVKYRLAAAILITVPGDVSPGFELGDVTAVTDGQTTTITGNIQNSGNIRVRPEGNLTFTNASGAVVVDAPIKMDSVYAGDSTTYQIFIPSPLPEGDYTVTVDLKDPDTGSNSTLKDVVVHVAAPTAPVPQSITAATFTPMPSADNIVYVQVSATISNTVAPQPGAEVSLRVYRDGVQVDEKALATSVTLQTGDTMIDQPYIPASGKWESGSYTFELVLSITDPTTGTRTEVATMKSDTEIVVP